MNDTKATVPISGRVTEEDFQFLMAYPISGKVTASEKLRYLVSFFRSYHESLGCYENSLQEINRLLEPAKKSLKKAENEQALSSDILDRLLQKLPEMLAQLITARIPEADSRQISALVALEEKSTQHLVSLLDATLRASLTRRAPAYNPRILSEKLDTIRELLELAQANLNPKS